MARIAFIGLGTMGLPMAANLVRTGHSLAVHDLSQANMAQASSAGAEAYENPAATLEGAEFVITMLPNGEIVRQVLGGNSGLFAQTCKHGAPLFIDCSTISPDEARGLASEADDHGVSFIDAPVSGGIQAAREATLAFMVGGTPEQFNRARPVIEVMARAIYHAGPVGNGQSAKICNNMLAAVIMAGSAEALALGESLGLDVEVLSAIIGQSSGGSFLLERWNPYPGIVAQAPASRDYNNGFQTQLMLKDLGLALDSARIRRRPVPMGALAHSLYALQLQSGVEAPLKDFSKILDVFRTGLNAPQTSR